MSDLRVANLKGRRPGSAPSLPDGAVVSGVTTSTSFSGNVTGNVTGIATGNVTGNVTGNITGTAGTFSGNVSVGGIITYEDVTSVDSVGVITARNGIRVSAGQSISAVSGIVTYYGDGSKLSGVESGVVNFVASGTIANGATVIIKDDGTVGTIARSGSDTPIVGSPTLFESAGVDSISQVYDSSNSKVVIAYKDSGNSSYGTAIVGTVSGSNITFGTPVVFASASTNAISATYDSTNGKVVIAYQDAGNSDYGTVIVGTVSGTSISFGSEVVFHSGATTDIHITYDSTNQKVVIVYRDTGNSNYGKAIVGTVSGTSISFGSESNFHNADTRLIDVAYDSSNNRVVIVYSDYGNSYHATAVVGTVSGTSISFGSDVVFNAANSSQSIAITYDSTNNKVVVAYQDTANSEYGTAIVGTVSGTSISFGSEVVFESAQSAQMSISYDSVDQKIVIAYRDYGNSNYGTVIVGTVSGTSISFGSPNVFETAETNDTSIAFDSGNAKMIIGYKDNGNSNYGTCIVFGATSKTSNLTAENYIGIAAEAIANGATGRINVLTGTNTGQTGLTTAQKYFVQNNGGISTSPGSPSVVAGTAISDTKIIVR